MSTDLLSKIRTNGSVPEHVAIVMDGTGFRAQRRRAASSHRHAHGVEALSQSIEGSIEAGIAVLTLLAAPREDSLAEVSTPTHLLEAVADAKNSVAQDVHVRVLGDMSTVSARARQAAAGLADMNLEQAKLELNLCVGYSSRAEITQAARQLVEEAHSGLIDPEDIDEGEVAKRLWTAGCKDPDLVIRTAGEFRISNCLLWQLAYSEIYVTPLPWPEFTKHTLYEAILDYQSRERRFGHVTS